jgi:hypothetical protein
MQFGRRSVVLLALLAVIAPLGGCGDPSSGPREIESLQMEDEDTLRGQVLSCQADVYVEVEESFEEVVLSVTVEGDTPADCIDGDFVADLDEPLGDREVIDGTSGETLEP